ncbi:MAG: Gfo/Idh/MocA family oxidoreductase [Oscillospiraceae bacterium]|nr:Gfo/Idh/MocA family oxidoreductase [Oscillospiraceae bacterium]
MGSLEFGGTYGHSPVEKMFGKKDVYGVGFDEERIAKKKIRLGIIGAGGVAQSKHIPAINRLRTIWEPVEIAAFSTRNKIQGDKISRLCGYNYYADYKDMLAGEELDGVIVSSGDEVHFEHTLACFEKNIHVICEKPLSRSLDEARRMVSEAEEKNLVFMTVSNKRYSPPYYRAKGLMDCKDGSIFKNPAMFCGKFNLGYDYVDILEGGTVHLFDLARYLMGDVLSLTACAVRRYDFNRTGYAFDNGVCMLEFKSGAIGALYTSTSALSLKPWERVEVYFEKAWFSVEDQRDLIIYDSEEGPAKSFSPVFPNTLIFDEEFGGFMPMLLNFIESIRGTEKPLVTGYDGMKAVELIGAFYKSLDSGGKIYI